MEERLYLDGSGFQSAQAPVNKRVKLTVRVQPSLTESFQAGWNRTPSLAQAALDSAIVQFLIKHSSLNRRVPQQPMHLRHRVRETETMNNDCKNRIVGY